VSATVEKLESGAIKITGTTAEIAEWLGQLDRKVCPILIDIADRGGDGLHSIISITVRLRFC